MSNHSFFAICTTFITDRKKQMKNKKRFPIWAVVVSILIVAFAVSLIVDLTGNSATTELSIDDAQKLIDSTFSSLPNSVSKVSKYISENSQITVKDISYGFSKNIIVSCDYFTIDAETTINEKAPELLSEVYAYYIDNESKGISTNATKVMLYISDKINKELENAKPLSGSIDIQIFETNEGLKVYLDDKTVNTCFGGILNAQKTIKEVNEVVYNGETVSIVPYNTLRNGCIDCIKLINYSSAKPESDSFYIRTWNKFYASFKLNFGNGNWKYLTKGLATTLEITLLSVCLGIVIGFIVAIVRCTHDKTGKLNFLNAVFKAYIAVIRGTPVMIQLLIIYFVILLPIGIQKFPAAVLCFGINSGSYVAEIVRGGLMSVDQGQEEAGRSLGFNYIQTMTYIIIPQAFKAILPALANEFISLLKETSIAFYIGVADLTQGGLKIRSITYSNFMPLIAVALIYFIIVFVLTKLVSLLEKRLRKSER